MKERLTGAIILVALIVLLVPELLSGPVRSAPQVAPAAAAEDAPLRSYTINLSDDAHPRSGTLPSSPQQPTPLAVAPAAPTTDTEASTAPSTSPGSAPPQATPAPTPSPAPRAKPARLAAVKAAAPAATPVDSAGPGGYVVQLGSFASRDNAERLAEQVKQAGFRVNVAQGSSGRHLYRVLVGPARDRTGATQLATKLQAAGHAGAIVPK